MSSWVWPVPGASTITSGVGPRWGREHRGIDISASKGTPVIATREGTIKSTNTSCLLNYGKPVGTDNCGGGYGNYIYIDHKDGYESRYAHLTSVLVKIGDYVTKGQQIGTVGSTGNSTGFHLHFEIRLNGGVQDPETYVSPSNSIEFSPYNYDTPTIQNEVPYTPLQIVGRRASQVTSQPMHAYVNIKIGDTILSPKPNIMQDFEITRYMGAGDTATFTIFDDTWSEIEKDFASNWNNIKIEYGYAGSNVKSQLYNMMLQTYSVSFNSTGVLLTVQAMSQGTSMNLEQTSIPTYTRNPTEAIRMIASAMGWTVLEENLDPTETLPESVQPFNIVNDFPVAYITDTIIPSSRAVDDGEIMRFYLDSNNVVYFKKNTYIPVITNESDEIKTYIYQKGYDSPIEDLTFDVKGVFGGTSAWGIASGERTSVFDPLTKEEIINKEDIKSVVTEATGESVHMSANQSVPSKDSAAYPPVQMRNKLYYDVKKSMTSHYEATMTIIGDPTINLLENIRIINVTDAGYLHHTSGIYMIKSIIDHVSDGSMSTTLKLIRNGTGYINDGVEILNPKVSVK